MDTVKKTVKEVFKDYDSNSFALNDARIVSINLYKKNGELELNLETSEKIKIKDLLKFEKYIEERFQILNVKIIINSANEEQINDEFINKSISEEWNDLLKYITHKHPMANAILKGSKISFEKNRIDVNLNGNGKAFLEGNKLDIKLSNIIQNLYGKKYKINYTDNSELNVSDSRKKNVEIINKITKEVKEGSLSKIEENKNKEQETASKKEKTKNAKPAKEVIAPPPAPIEEESPIIYGRNQKVNDAITKIQDITVDSGNVTIVGTILKIELDGKDDNINLGIKTRELKNGKFLVIFSVYDNTNTINCKAFVTSDKIEKITKRLKKAPKVRVVGTAQFDPYSKEIGILANAIIEEPEEKKQERMDNAEVKRVELHMHTQMSAMDGVSSAKDLIKRAM